MRLDLADKNRSVRAQWALNHASINIRRRINNPPHLPGNYQGQWPGQVSDDHDLPHAPPFKPGPTNGPSLITNPRVAIVGAGAAGLFTAMILDYLNTNVQGFNVAYDIYEANQDTSLDQEHSRLGGRLFTWNFTEKDADPRHNYFDLGAMRFPDASSQAPFPNPIMTRLFDLFATLNMKPNDLADASIGDLIPYQMTNTITSSGITTAQEYFHYNNTSKVGSYTGITTTDANHDPFSMNTLKQIPDGLITQDPDTVLNNTIAYFRGILQDSTAEDAWSTLMNYDQYTTRAALLNPPQPSPPPALNYETVQWLETFNGGTGWYDQALSETVLESLDFEFNDDPTKNTWRCILGGAQQLALNMASSLKGNQPVLGQRVTAIRALDPLTMQIDVNNATVNTPYNGVFNSTTLGCLSRIDTSGVVDRDTTPGLDYTTREAVRALSYGPSAKVGILFDHAWWMYDLAGSNNPPTPDLYNITTGGLGHSDLNLRTVVYPSYNADLKATDPAVLLASYTWQQDALRMGALMSSSADPTLANAEEELNGLKTLLIRELATLHTTPTSPLSQSELEAIITKSWITHYSHDWTRDPNCAGAFAFFAPQQFQQLWPSIINPKGNLVIIGEAASPHHAWVVGALESAVYGVYSWLTLRKGDIPGAEAALELLGTAKEGVPFVGLPAYMEPNTAAWAGIFGRLDEEGFWAGRRATGGK